MTSQINPNNINGAYPVAGQDNNSQGFRDNFTNTSTNFQYAAQEITALQSQAILNSQLSGGANLSVQNNMLNSPLSNALVSDFAYVYVSLGTLSGSVPINYATGHYQHFTMGGDVSLAFSNWPISGQDGQVYLSITVNNTGYTLTLPSAVYTMSDGSCIGIQGLVYPAGSSPVIEFAATGTYHFEFATSNNGTNIRLSESIPLLQPFNNTKETRTSGNISLATTTTYFTGAGTTTLNDGVEGQIKVLTQAGNASMTVTVTDAGWKDSVPGTAGNITLATRGSGCTLQYTNSVWYCIGTNDATFS
jgi:hypothetical protein